MFYETNLCHDRIENEIDIFISKKFLFILKGFNWEWVSEHCTNISGNFGLLERALKGVSGSWDFDRVNI